MGITKQNYTRHVNFSFFNPLTTELIVRENFREKRPQFVANLYSVLVSVVYMLINVEEKVVVIHRGRCNNKVYYRLSHDVVT